MVDNFLRPAADLSRGLPGLRSFCTNTKAMMSGHGFCRWLKRYLDPSKKSNSPISQAVTSLLKEVPIRGSLFQLNQRHARAQHVEYLCFELPGVDRLGHIAVESAREYLLVVGCEGESRQDVYKRQQLWPAEEARSIDTGDPYCPLNCNFR